VRFGTTAGAAENYICASESPYGCNKFLTLNYFKSTGKVLKPGMLDSTVASEPTWKYVSDRGLYTRYVPGRVS
jgi:hypothetical protein